MNITNVVKTIVIDPQGRVLLLRRAKDDTSRPGEWDFPGGGLEQGESLVETAVREAAEEAGLTLRSEDVTLVYAATRPSSKGEVSVNRFVFATVLKNSYTPTLSYEHEEYTWVPIDEVPTVFSHPVYAAALQYVMKHELIAL